MQSPSADELAAIVAAYARIAARRDPPAEPEASRWRLAGRFPAVDAQRARSAARATSRWNAAGRLGG
jgi:hypothetical protein